MVLQHLTKEETRRCRFFNDTMILRSFGGKRVLGWQASSMHCSLHCLAACCIPLLAAVLQTLEQFYIAMLLCSACLTLLEFLCHAAFS